MVSEFDDYIEGAADTVVVATITRDIPGLADSGVFGCEFALVAQAPSQTQRAPNAGIDASDQFEPVAVGTVVLIAVLHIVAPHGVLDSGAVDIILEGGIAIAATHIDAVHVVLVAQHVEVYTHTAVGSRGLVAQSTVYIVGIGMAHTQLDNGEIAVAQIETGGSLVLAIVAQTRLDDAHEVERHCHSAEEGYGVAVGKGLALVVLRLQRQGHQQKHEANCQDS